MDHITLNALNALNRFTLAVKVTVSDFKASILRLSLFLRPQFNIERGCLQLALQSTNSPFLSSHIGPSRYCLPRRHLQAKLTYLETSYYVPFLAIFL